jgi:hypothetical protein
MDTKFLEFEENCVFKTEFEEGLKKIVRRSFDLDDLGLKDNIRTSGLGFAKNPKRTENEWIPAEKLIEGKIIVTHVTKKTKFRSLYLRNSMERWRTKSCE